MKELNPPAIVIESQAEMEQLAFEATSALEAGRKAALTTIERYKEAGEALAKAKSKCKHGQWLPWLAQHKITNRTASKAIRIAANYEKLALRANLNEALEYLAADGEEQEIGSESHASQAAFFQPEASGCRECRIMGAANCPIHGSKEPATNGEKASKTVTEQTGPGDDYEAEDEPGAEPLVQSINRAFGTLEAKAIELAKLKAGPEVAALEKAGKAHRELLDIVIALPRRPARPPQKGKCDICGMAIMRAENEKGDWRSFDCELKKFGKYDLIENIMTEIEESDTPAYAYHNWRCGELRSNQKQRSLIKEAPLPE